MDIGMVCRQCESEDASARQKERRILFGIPSKSTLHPHVVETEGNLKEKYRHQQKFFILVGRGYRCICEVNLALIDNSIRNTLLCEQNFYLNKMMATQIMVYRTLEGKMDYLVPEGN
jgi:hypothetical protein